MMRTDRFKELANINTRSTNLDDHDIVFPDLCFSITIVCFNHPCLIPVGSTGTT
jgi:hypothetical protein